MESLKIIIPLLIVICLCIWVVRRVIADEKGNSPIIIPKGVRAFGKESWITRIALGLGTVLSIWVLYQRDSGSLGSLLLGGSILTIIAGFTTLVSKRTRDRAKAISLVAEPDRAKSFNSPGADSKARRRGYIILLVGGAMFLLWCATYGFSSLAMGV